MEVLNQQLETMLQANVQTDQKDWVLWLDVLQLAYNNMPHSLHKSAPLELLLGYRPQTPLELLKESGLTTANGHPNLQQHLRDLQAHRDSAKDAIQGSLDKQAYYYDKGLCLPNLKVGDEVLLNLHSLKLMDVKGKSHKLVQ
jgi:hypothetical protein